MEYNPAPIAVVGGKNIEPMEETKTTPRPMASGAPIVRNFSLGAQTCSIILWLYWYIIIIIDFVDILLLHSSKRNIQEYIVFVITIDCVDVLLFRYY